MQNLLQDHKIINIGEKHVVTLPHSEVMIHMKVAGQQFVVQLLKHGMAQLWKDGSPFSAPVTDGEAGLYFNTVEGYHYYY